MSVSSRVTSTLVPTIHPQLALKKVPAGLGQLISWRVELPPCSSARHCFDSLMCLCILIKTTGSCTFDRDVLDGEAEDDGPDHSQGHLGVSVHDFCTSRGKRQRGSAQTISLLRLNFTLERKILFSHSYICSFI